MEQRDHASVAMRQPVGGRAPRIGDEQVRQRDHAGHAQQHDLGIDRRSSSFVNHLLGRFGAVS
jgi:hypothetical protein